MYDDHLGCRNDVSTTDYRSFQSSWKLDLHVRQPSCLPAKGGVVGTMFLQPINVHFSQAGSLTYLYDNHLGCRN